jgi:hypothetical protein
MTCFGQRIGGFFSDIISEQRSERETKINDTEMLLIAVIAEWQ